MVATDATAQAQEPQEPQEPQGPQEPQEPQEIVLAGVPLVQYAAVVVALGEEFELAEILDVEGLEAATWREAYNLFRTRLGTDPVCLARYQQHVIEAQDRLRRSVTPIEQDVDAWVAFLGAWKRHPNPPALLAENGLRASDLARLERGWRAKFEANEALAVRGRRAALRDGESPAPFPAIRAGVTLLTPSPAARPRTAPRNQGTPPATAAGLRLGLYEFAMITSELRASDPDARVAVFERHGLPAQAGEQAMSAFQLLVDEDARLRHDFQALCRHFDARTALGRLSQPPPPMPATEMPATAIAATPMPAIGPDDAPGPSSAAEIDVTAEALIAIDDVLPFEAPASRSAIMLIPWREIEAAERSLAPPGGTAAAGEYIDKPALPFEADAALPCEADAATGTGTLSLDAFIDVPAPPSRAPGPAGTPRTPGPEGGTGTIRLDEPIDVPPALPDLSVTEFASLCAELAARPGQTDSITARYRLGAAADKIRLDGIFRERFRADVALRAEFQRLYGQYFEWLSRR